MTNIKKQNNKKQQGVVKKSKNQNQNNKSQNQNKLNKIINNNNNKINKNNNNKNNSSSNNNSSNKNKNNNKLKVISNKSNNILNNNNKVVKEKEEKQEKEVDLDNELNQEDDKLENEDDNEKYSLWNPKPVNNNSNKNNSNTGNKKSNLQNQMSETLKGGHFRWLNELLYVSHSQDAFKQFTSDKTLFDQYHSGFKSQVESWPINPLDIIISELKLIKQKKRIADLGCGEARLSETLNKQHQVYSFDLVAVNDRVTSCDISNLPLENESIDIAVFCLSLMGTNFMDFLNEAKRILVNNGILKIAEIESRITNINVFIEEIEKLGFKLIKKNEKNEYFTLFEFSKLNNNKKNNNSSKLKRQLKQQQQDTEPILKPCLYKKR